MEGKSILAATITLLLFLHTADAQTGVCYGTLGSNLPSPADMIALCKQHNIQRIRIYNPNPAILQALSNSGISVIVGVANEDIPGIAKDAGAAKSWVQNNILKYPSVTFRYIAVGNELSPLPGTKGNQIAPSVPQAMQNIYDAVSAAGLASKIKVSTVLGANILGNSYPPSAGVFKPEIVPSYINPIVRFLIKTQAPFLANVYPYFAYISDPQDISLPYAIFTSPAPVVTDGPYKYWNLFSAIYDAFNAALEKVGGASIGVVVTETGWPSDGGTATSVDNARTYNSKLVEYVKGGSPRRPGKAIETYIFDLVDEDQKTPEYEKHWGVFLANKNLKYPITFS